MTFANASTFFPLPLAQAEQVTNWLTPVWMISVGFTIGFALVLLVLAKIWVCQRIPFINSVEKNKPLHIGLGVVTGLIYVGVFVGFSAWRMSPFFEITEFIFPIAFVTPFFLFLGYGVWAVISKRMIGETSEIFFEGFLRWVNVFMLAMVAFCIGGFVLSQADGFGVIKFVEEPNAMMESLGRLPATGTFTKSFKIPPGGQNDVGHEVAVNFSGQELQKLEITTTKQLSMAWKPMVGTLNPGYIFDIPVRDDPLEYRQRSDGRGKIPHNFIDNLYVRNLSSTEAELEMTWTIAPIYREVAIIPVVAFWTMLGYLFYLVFAAVSPKVYAIAHSTFKTEISQPLYTLVLAIGVVFMIASIYIPYNTFGEDIKMYKDSGLTLIRVMAIFLAIWAASKSVAEEIEGRTALTVLSKPVGRRQFVFGKFTGISWAITLLFIILGFWLVAWVAYKPVYDYKEAAKGICEWTVCYREAVHIIPGIVLCLMEVLIFVAISVAISTRLGAMANFLICFSIYVLGHLTPRLVQSSDLAEIDTIVVFANLIAVIFPVADYFDVQTAINTSADVPWIYMGWSVVYTALYGAMAMLLALILFEDRDLA
ncbi:MAG: hypothetical protein AAFN77_04375 [Planctomycetota bacterium]